MAEVGAIKGLDHRVVLGRRIKIEVDILGRRAQARRVPRKGDSLRAVNDLIRRGGRVEGAARAVGSLHQVVYNVSLD